MALVRGDVGGQALLRELLPGHDAVGHFAAESHVGRSIAAGAAFVTTNVGGTRSLPQACLHTGVERLVHASTDEVHGSIAPGAASVTTNVGGTRSLPQACLHTGVKRAVHASTDEVHGSIAAGAASVTTNVGGTRSLLEACLHTGVKRVVHGSIAAGSWAGGSQESPWRRTPPAASKAGADPRAATHGRWCRARAAADDHCRAVRLVPARGGGGGTCHVGCGGDLTDLEITERLLGLYGAGPEMVRHVPDRKGHDLRYSPADSEIRERLGYVPRVPFAWGPADTVAGTATARTGGSRSWTGDAPTGFR